MIESRFIIGFIGLGRMGMPMAINLLKAGFQLIVYNRSRVKVDEMVRLGAQGAYSAKETTQACDVLLTCLPDVSTVKEVFLGEQGILLEARPGQIFVDHSTVGPTTSKDLGLIANRQNACFLDAPISGGVERATDATLTIMVGGELEVFRKTLPVFQAIGSNIKYAGPQGAGSTVKLINQLLVGIHSLGAAEALLLGIHAGADPELLLDILGTSWGSSFMLSRNGQKMIDRDFDNAKAPSQLLIKDMGLVTELASEIGIPIPCGNQTFNIFQEATNHGIEELDIASVITLLEKRVKESQSQD